MIIVVSAIRNAFLRNHYNFIPILRKFFPTKPIVLYTLEYLPTRPQWYKWLKEGSEEAEIIQPDNHGMERYDYYLAASSMSKYPKPKIDNPLCELGINLQDAALYPERKDKLIALVDLERKKTLHERSIIIRALEETKTEYIVLRGHYKIEEIRSIYRRCSIYFVSLDEGLLTSNFIIYDNDINKLKDEIMRIKNAIKVVGPLKKFFLRPFLEDVNGPFNILCSILLSGDAVYGRL